MADAASRAALSKVGDRAKPRTIVSIAKGLLAPFKRFRSPSMIRLIAAAYRLSVDRFGSNSLLFIYFPLKYEELPLLNFLPLLQPFHMRFCSSQNGAFSAACLSLRASSSSPYFSRALLPRPNQRSSRGLVAFSASSALSAFAIRFWCFLSNLASSSSCRLSVAPTFI